MKKKLFNHYKKMATGNHGAYSADLNRANAELTWPGITVEKLKKIAETVDPTGLFDQGLTIRNFS